MVIRLLLLKFKRVLAAVKCSLFKTDRIGQNLFRIRREYCFLSRIFFDFPLRLVLQGKNTSEPGESASPSAGLVSGAGGRRVGASVAPRCGAEDLLVCVDLPGVLPI